MGTIDQESLAEPIKLVVVVPCHNEEESLPLFLAESDRYLKGTEIDGHPWESSYVFVDDGSTDQTLQSLRELAERREDVHYCSFSRNFGKEAALLCGMNRALEMGATHISVIDADLQDPPRLFPEMLHLMDTEGFDVVAAYRRTRTGEPALRSWFARRFYQLENAICDVEMRDGARDFRVMARRVAESICSLPERERFSKGLFQWVGFRCGWIGYDNTERVAGASSWSFFSLVRYAIDGLISFSIVPLEAISVLGFAISLLALLGLLWVFTRALLFGNPVSGWPSLACIVLLLGGLQLCALGLIGLYLSKVLSEVKGRPMYFVAEQDAPDQKGRA